MGGWFLSPRRDDADSLKMFKIPDGTSVPAGGFLVFEESQFNPQPGLAGSFRLDELGDELFLTATDAGEALTGYIAGVDFGAGRPEVPFGRHETSTGLDFTAMGAVTLGAENARPFSPEVVINEIHYHPPDGGIEFVELYNPGKSSVSLGGWKLGGLSAPPGTASFVFPLGSVVPGGGYLLLVPSEPSLFRSLYPVPTDVDVLGPYSGALDNGGERLRLRRPVSGAEDAFVLIDHVRYNDRAPWPLEPDGDGPSLERIRAADYGNEVLNWAASEVPGATPGFRNSVSPPLGPVDGRMIPGDINQDADLNILDGTVLLGHLFAQTNSPLPCGELLLDEGNRELLDGNGDARVDITDAVYLLTYLLLEGPRHVLGTDCAPVINCPDLCE